MPIGEPDIFRDDFNLYSKQLKEKVGKVYETDRQWLNHLKEEFDQFENDLDTKSKIAILENLDEALNYSFADFLTPSVANLDESLSGMLVEIEGYKRLTNRYLADFRKLSETDRSLQQAALDARNALFNQVAIIESWLDQQKVGIKPSEFDSCTEEFLDRMLSGSTELTFTQQLFSNRFLELSESELKNLVTAWGDVVSKFIRDAQDTDHRNVTSDGVNFGESATIADFLCIHDRLDTLYGRLATNVTRE